MKKNIGSFSRILLVVCSIALIIVLFVPLWKIDLVAPQYPEGLSLLIYPHKLGGNVDIVNGLNHYIGMKTLHTHDFIEFTILPYLIAFYALLFLVAAMAGKRKVLNIVFILFLIFGIVAMADFYKWEYDYGHNLSPDAAIQVPGMTYQPPLIGYKQLLNFSAYSIPDIGGWIFIGVGGIALLCVILVWKSGKRPQYNYAVYAVLSMLLMQGATSCNTSPEPIRIGKDHCSFCKMTITDARYGAEVITKKGKIYKFDDSHCVLAFLKTNITDNELSEVYLSSFDGDHRFLDVNSAFLFKSDGLNAPMGGNIAAFSNKDSLQQLSKQYEGVIVSWSELKGK